MAERKSGLPVDPTSPLLSQIISPLVPMSYRVDRPYSVNTQEVDGGVLYSETPQKVSDLQFDYPPIVSGGIEFFKKLMEDPTGTASGIASGVVEELEEYPKRQLRTAMAGGEYYNPETGEVERYDPFAVPSAQAVGTRLSIAQAEGLGPFIGMLGGKPASNSLVQKYGFYQDNPDTYRGNNEYTQGNAAYVERTMPEGSDYLRGPQTAILGRDLSKTYSGGPKQEKPLMLPAELLHRIPGAMHEARSARNPDIKYDRLSETVKEEGFDRDQKQSGGVIVGVNHLGQAYIIEGNTRAALAFDQGIPSLKAEVRYYNGGEMIDGPFSPQRMAAYSEFGVQTGGDIFGMAGGRRSRPTDPVTAVDLGGGRQGIRGLAHGVKRGDKASKNITIKMSKLDKIGASNYMAEPKQKLLEYAKANNLIGEDGNIRIDRAEFITLMGLDNRVRQEFTGGSPAKSAEVDREGFSVSGDPYLSFVNFAGEAGDFKDLDELLVAETKGLTRKDVQDLSPAEYLMAQYDPKAKVLKKPNTRFFEDESHFGKDPENYSTMRRLTDQERDRFSKIADKNKAAINVSNQAVTLFRGGKADIFDVARSTRDAFNNVQGVHAERMVEFATLDRLAKIFNDPDQIRLIHRMEDSLGENEVAELANVAQAYRMARKKAVSDDNFLLNVLDENAEVLEKAYKEELAQFPDFAGAIKVEALGTQGKRYAEFTLDDGFVAAMQEHADNLRRMETADGLSDNVVTEAVQIDPATGDLKVMSLTDEEISKSINSSAALKVERKAALDASTANLKKHPLYKRFTFEDPKTGRLMFRAMLEEDQIKAPNTYKLREDIKEALLRIDRTRTGQTTTEATLDFINSTIPTSFAGPLKQLAKNARTIEERVRTNINNRPLAAEFNQAYRDYKAATKEFVDHLSRIADQGPQSPLYNYMDKSGPETKFKDITVRDNPAVKFEDGGPVRAGIANFIKYMQ